MKSYLALLSMGKNDFEAINNIESEFYLMQSMGVKEVPCEATLRQRMNKYANKFLSVVEKSSLAFLSNMKPTLHPLSSDHIPIDADVTQMGVLAVVRKAYREPTKAMAVIRRWPFIWGRKVTISTLNSVKENNTVRKTPQLYSKGACKIRKW